MTLRNGLKVLAIVRSQELAQTLNEAVGRGNGVKLDVRVGELKKLGLQLALSERPDAVLFDINTEDPEDWDVISQVKRNQTLAATPVLATSAQTTSTTIRRLIRDGVDDFIPQPPSPSDVLEALESASRKLSGAHKASGGHGRVVSFLRAAGGMGATTLALHAAMCFLGENGARRRVDKRSVCLIDLDVQFGTVALALDLVPNDGLLEIMRTPTRLDGALLRGASVAHPSGLHVLTAPRSSIPLDALTPPVLIRLLEVARQEFEYVVVDTPASLMAWTEPLLAVSDTIYVVSQLSVSALGQTRRLLDALDEDGHYGLPLNIVVNRYRKRFGDTLDLRHAERALNHKIDHIVPNDYDLVTKAHNQGVPVYSVKRRSRVGDSVTSIVTEALKKAKASGQDAVATHA